MKDATKLLTSPLFITLAIIIIGVGGLVAAFKYIPDQNKEYASAVERSWGKQDSTIVVTEYGDFQCPGCRSFYETTETQLKEKYQDKIKFVFKHFPLSIHASARAAAEAAEAAGAQGKFWEYHDMLYQKQTADADASAGDKWTTTELVGYAKDLGLDTEKFERELKNDYYGKVVRDAEKAAQDKELTGTPTVFVNEEQISNPSLETLQPKIDELLSKSGSVSPTPTINVPSTLEATITPTPVQ